MRSLRFAFHLRILRAVLFIGSVVVPIQIRNQNSICGGDSQTVLAVLLVSSRVRVKFPLKSNKPVLRCVVF